MDDEVDSFPAHRAGSLDDAALLLGRFEVLSREVSEIRGMTERIMMSMTAALGDSKEVRAELASIVNLIGKLHDRNDRWMEKFREDLNGVIARVTALENR